MLPDSVTQVEFVLNLTTASEPEAMRLKATGGLEIDMNTLKTMGRCWLRLGMLARLQCGWDIRRRGIAGSFNEHVFDRVELCLRLLVVVVMIICVTYMRLVIYK